MNLLFDFLKFLGKPERERLISLKLKGTALEVWEIIHTQIKEDHFNKEKILKELGISASHLDKITSELLSKCYFLLFGSDSLRLLELLGNRLAYLKHFYAELNRRLNYIKGEMTIEEQKHFYKKCMDIIMMGIPIAYRDEDVLKKLAARYLTLFKGEEKKHASLAMGSRLLLVRIDVLFASGTTSAHALPLEKELNNLARLTPGADEELLFDFYWLKMYYYNALENFSMALSIAKEANGVLGVMQGASKDLHLFRLQLKSAEYLYYLSRFDEAFDSYHRLVNEALFGKIPDGGYHATKYIQICLITGHIKEAGNKLDARFGEHSAKISEWITPRDIFSFIKYHLFNNEYEQAFRFIQMGFEKNPKGKYFQYEIELRNLQTAYFIFTKQEETAIDLCRRSIKYLRNHGYGISNADFPHFYVLAEAIIKKNATGQPFTKKQQAMLDRYQLGSYAVYGKLLLRMLG